MHEYIRDSIDIVYEDENAGSKLSDPEIDIPPCGSECAAFSNHGITVTHTDPVEWRGLPSFTENIPPKSCTARPYGRMLDHDNPDRTWISDPEEQQEALGDFFKAFELEKSLVFFYIDYPHPLGVDEGPKTIVGVSRITNIGDQYYYPPSDRGTGDDPVWSRCITHGFPEDGIRLPYHEYINSGEDPSSMICEVPSECRASFSYVSEHIDDDQAVVLLDAIAESLRRGSEEDLITYDWDSALEWIDSILDQVWKNRGLYPGIGSVLNYLGFGQGHLFQREGIQKYIENGNDPLFETLQVLEEEKKTTKSIFKRCWKQASKRWKTLSDTRKELLKTLCKFGLTDAQVERIVGTTKRKNAGIDVKDKMIIENPYLISELDRGGVESEPVRFGIIDRGQIPAASIGQKSKEFIPTDENDPNRIRAAIAETLQDISNSEGHTFMPLETLMQLLCKKVTSDRRIDTDQDRVLDNIEYFEERLVFTDIEETWFAELKSLAVMKELVRTTIEDLLNFEADKLDVDWQDILRVTIGDDEDDEYEKFVRAEKEISLEKISSERFSVLTGSAGTGKTKVIEALIEGLESSEGKHDLLLLAPTGKARVRLEQATGRSAKTIHQFLFENDWIDKDTYALKSRGTKAKGVFRTVVIDESSMIPLDLFATLIKAVKWDRVRRLVLVGDPNQLPPIGPGRPFVDILAWLIREEYNSNIARLNMIVRHRGVDSEAIALAQAFRSDSSMVDDDEILSKVARSDLSTDLKVRYWKNPDELHQQMIEVLEEELGFDFDEEDYETFNESLGLNNKETSCIENWQILTPTRVHHFGTIEINRMIQTTFRGRLIKQSRFRNKPRPFGPSGLVYLDKVVQIVNKRKWGLKDKDSYNGYVANGEVGAVLSTKKKGKSEYIWVSYSSQSDVWYKYSRSQTDELELAYALTVHKAQGSEFKTVFLILPKKGGNVSRELLYTGLTRFREKMVLLIQEDIGPLLENRQSTKSGPSMRWTNLFGMPDEVPEQMLFIPEGLIHRTANGELVRSKSEVIVADTLHRLDVDYDYERRLENPSSPDDFRLPDFTIYYRGKVFYWEHLGMLSNPDYVDRWNKKLQWYEKCGYGEQIVTSEDGPDGSIDSSKIASLAKRRILREED